MYVEHSEYKTVIPHDRQEIDKEGLPVLVDIKYTHHNDPVASPIKLTHAGVYIPGRRGTTYLTIRELKDAAKAEGGANVYRPLLVAARTLLRAPLLTSPNCSVAAMCEAGVAYTRMARAGRHDIVT
jgi:hypothetical protein